MPWRECGSGVFTDEEVRLLYLDTYGTRRTDVEQILSSRQPIEIAFGDGLITLTWEPDSDDGI